MKNYDKKRKMSDEKILENDAYRSILYLLERYSKSDNGLRAEHFKYALFPDGRNDELDEFFTINDLKGKKIRLSDFSKDQYFPTANRVIKKRIVPGSVKNSVQLNDRLRYLIKRKWVKTRGESKYYEYFLTSKYYNDKHNMKIKKSIGKFKEKSIIQRGNFISTSLIDKKVEFGDSFLKNLSDSGISWTLFGIPRLLLFYSTIEENRQLKKWINQIEKNFEKIMNFKYKKFLEKEDFFKNSIFNEDFEDEFNMENTFLVLQGLSYPIDLIDYWRKEIKNK